MVEKKLAQRPRPGKRHSRNAGGKLHLVATETNQKRCRMLGRRIGDDNAVMWVKTESIQPRAAPSPRNRNRFDNVPILGGRERASRENVVAEILFKLDSGGGGDC